MRSEALLTVGAVCAIGLFSFALMQVAKGVFETGEVYPVYSSLRSDSAGTKVLYESLVRTDGIVVTRRFESLGGFRGNQTTLLILGVPPMLLTLSPDSAKQFEDAASRGNRVVVSLPVCAAAKGQPSVNRLPPMKQWQVSWTCVAEPAQPGSKPGRPDHYAITQQAAGWTVLTSDRHGQPIAIERAQGTGSLVVVTDAYLFSNVALVKHRETDLLARIIGSNRSVIFDEFHLGVQEQEGIVSLARRYRLHGVFGVVLLLAILFAWRNSTSFLPMIAEVRETDEVAGRDAASGLASVLRRAIPRSELIRVCVEEWSRSIGAKAAPEDVGRVRELAAQPSSVSMPVEMYQTIARTLKERRRR